ncbi:MAG: hypothetical protein ACFE7R_09170, partial [Candidatus Hodarchaeota archaeon]
LEKLKERDKDKALWRDFLSENAQTVRLIFAIMPGVVGVIALDSISDSIFNYGALIYTNEFLYIDVTGINIMVLVPLIISFPLLFKVGRISDQRGIRRAALMVYSIMPVCALLLIIAPQFPYWAPLFMVDGANSILNGLGIVFTTPFLALVTKGVNDQLWGLVYITLIQKRMPRTDTSKILGVFWSIIFIINPIGPFLGGLIFTYFYPSVLFLVVLCANLIILGGIARFGLEGNTSKEPLDKNNESL